MRRGGLKWMLNQPCHCRACVWRWTTQHHRHAAPRGLATSMKLGYWPDDAPSPQHIDRSDQQLAPEVIAL